MYICIDIHTHAHTYMYVCVCVCVCIHIYVLKRRGGALLDLPSCMYVYILSHTHICIYVCVYVCVFVCVFCQQVCTLYKYTRNSPKLMSNATFLISPPVDTCISADTNGVLSAAQPFDATDSPSRHFMSISCPI